MGGFGGGGNDVKGLSANENERQQRLAGNLAQQSAIADLDLQAVQNQLLFGGPFERLQTSGIHGRQTEAPTGPAFNLVNQALQSELGLSGQRQDIARQTLQQGQASLDPTNQFNLSALGGGGLAQQAQLGLLGSAVPGFQGIQGLGQQLTGGLSDFFASGGAPSDAQREQIGNIFDAQREIGRSNLDQGFDAAIRRLQDQATTRGLRFGDTPIQDRGGLLAGEFARNLTNLESSLGGQQAQALLGQPFQQAQLGGQLQGQQSNQMLNLINAFSQPVSQGFNANQALTGQRQFGQQLSPAGASAAPLQNIAGLLGGGNFANTAPTFSSAGIAQNPSFGQTLGQSVASGIGQAIPAGVSGAAKAGAFSHPDLKEAITLMDDEALLGDVRRIPIYRWQYKGETTRHVGGMTTDMPDAIIAGDVEKREAFDLISYIGMLTAAIRALDTEVQQLKAGA